MHWKTIESEQFLSLFWAFSVLVLVICLQNALKKHWKWAISALFLSLFSPCSDNMHAKCIEKPLRVSNFCPFFEFFQSLLWQYACKMHWKTIESQQFLRFYWEWARSSNFCAISALLLRVSSIEQFLRNFCAFIESELDRAISALFWSIWRWLYVNMHAKCIEKPLRLPIFIHQTRRDT